MSREYRICTRCIMDTTDRNIQFDPQGVCNHCRQYDRLVSQYPFNDEEAKRRELERIVREIKAENKNDYDCVIGVSGGVDSTYVAYIVRNLGLKPLAVHLDNGWDSELAVHNIEKVLRTLDIDLYTHVLDWEEFKDLQLAFLKASVSDAEVPTDHAIVATLYQVAVARGIRHIIVGNNTATESGIPTTWTYGTGDWRYIQSIHQRFGRTRLSSYPHYSILRKVYYKYIRRIRALAILDYLPYSKQQAMAVLQNELGWQYYGGKHYESIYTRFFQGYLLPEKFNIDKRRAHLSALMRSGQTPREDALRELQVPNYSGVQLEEDREYVIKKLELTEKEFAQIMAAPIRTHLDYPTYFSLLTGLLGKTLAVRVRSTLRSIGI